MSKFLTAWCLVWSLGASADEATMSMVGQGIAQAVFGYTFQGASPQDTILIGRDGCTMEFHFATVTEKNMTRVTDFFVSGVSGRKTLTISAMRPTSMIEYVLLNGVRIDFETQGPCVVDSAARSEICETTHNSIRVERAAGRITAIELRSRLFSWFPYLANVLRCEYK